MLVRLLSRRYLFVLFAVALLMIVDQAIIQPLLLRLTFYAPAINVAGRQRMLSQKVTKEALALAAAHTPIDAVAHRKRLVDAISQWTTAHQGLLEGNPALGLAPVRDQRTIEALHALEPGLFAIHTAATTIATEGELSHGMPPNRSIAMALDTILTEEPKYLTAMEAVVGMLEASAGRQVSFLRWCGLAAMLTVLGLLVGMYFVVLRPATKLIREQIARLSSSETQHRVLAGLLAEARDELESRVEERTSELVESNRALAHEVAERKAAEARMRDLSSELAHASRVTALSQLATGLAHEVNQPLASIANYADVLELSLEDGDLNVAQARSTIARLKQASLRAGRIVRRMRNFVRKGSGQQSDVDLNTLIREVCDLCRPQLEQASVRLTTDLADFAVMIRAEPLEIQQVAVNLVHNAAQAVAHCPHSQRQINIRTHVASATAFVEIADTGPGFTTAAAEDSFAPFFSTKPEGLGMGLAISRTIMERSQGQLWAENRDTGGAVVGFCLPLAPTNDAQASSETDCLCR